MQRPTFPTLVDMAAGDAACIIRVDPADASRLAAEGLAPGDRVRVEARLPLGGPIVLRVGRARVAVARRVAAGILVERETAAP